MAKYDTATDPLMQPFQLRHLTLRNRLMTTAHEPNYSEDGMPKDRYRAYHVERAKGGLALTMTAGSAVVSEDSPAAFGNLHAYRDEIVPWMKRLSDECHDHGAAVMIQLTHLGRRTNWNHSDWLPVLSASGVREPAHRAIPKIAEDWDLARITADYADAAARMQEAGLDGIELEAYGHLLDQFWSPATNRRDDAYGGSLDNRMRLSLEVLAAIRARVGSEFIVGIRMVADEQWDIGLTADDGREIARKLVASGHVDFLNIIRGHIDSDAALADVIPVMGMASAPHLDFAGAIRADTRFPVFHAAKIADVATARHAVAEGKLDMVGMTRAHIADPHIVSKIRAGREQDIRPCVGATYCLDRIYEGHEAFCIHNPATGRELSLPHLVEKASNVERVVVVGAGPAGLEAALVCAGRGHQVTVLEAAPSAGGQVRIASRGPGRADMIGIVDWRVAQCEEAGVDFRFNVFADTDDVTGLQPSVVLIATGGVPDTGFLGEGEELAVTSWDVLSGEVPPASDILVFDDNGAHQGLQAAQWLAEAGSAVEIVTPERFFAPDIGGLNHVSYAKAFQRHNVDITLNTRLASITREGNRLAAHLKSDYLPDWTQTRVVDQVVVENGTVPVDDLYFALKPHAVNSGALDYRALIHGSAQPRSDGYALYRIGDAVASRNIHAAIYDAARLCSVL